MSPTKLTIAIQKQILRLLDSGHTYEQIMAELHVGSTAIARTRNRRQAYREGLVDTPYHGQPMNTSGKTYIPTPAEIKRRCEIVRKRNNEEEPEPHAGGWLEEVGIRIRGVAR